MIHRTGRLLLEIAGILVGGLLVLAAIAIWRLSTAPVEARFVRPYLEQAINDARLGFDVQLAETRIVWHKFRPVLGVNFHGVSVTGPDGQKIGGLQDGTLSISVRDLVFGRVSIVEIDLRKPEMTIVRGKDDQFALRVGHPTGDEPSSAEDTDFGSVLKRFIEEPNDQSPFGRLRRVNIVDGKVTIDDRKLGISWSAPDVNIDMGRTATQTRANVSVLLDLPHHAARLAGQARYVRGEGKIHLALNVDNFDAAAAAPLAQVLSPLSVLAIPVGGKVQAVLSKGGEVLSGEADLHGEQGQFVYPDWYPTPLALKTVDLKLHFTSAPEHLVLDRMAIDLGDTKIKIAGTADFTGPNVAIDAKADIADIPLARFDAIWPHGMATGGRDWVTTHIPEGVIKTATLHVAASGPQNDPAQIQATTVAGAFDYTGMEVYYFPALPPIRAITGHATFDTTRMDLSIDSGTLEDIAVSKGVIAMTGLDREDRDIDIGLTAQGPVKTLLTILDMKPLGYAHDIGLDPAGASRPTGPQDQLPLSADQIAAVQADRA